MSHQQLDLMESEPRFKVSSERPEKRGGGGGGGVDLATAGLIVQRVIRYTTAAPG